MTLQLSTTWSSAHFYHHRNWDSQKNRKQFGKCFSTYGHGHDYRLEVAWHVESDQILASLKGCLEDLREHLDHHHLNFMIPEFKETVPTTENLALYCTQFLDTQLQTKQLPKIKSLKLFEKPDLWVELFPDPL